MPIRQNAQCIERHLRWQISEAIRTQGLSLYWAKGGIFEHYSRAMIDAHMNSSDAIETDKDGKEIMEIQLSQSEGAEDVLSSSRH